MTLLTNALSSAFPALQGVDPLVLGPLLALAASLGLILVIGTVLAVQDSLGRST